MPARALADRKSGTPGRGGRFGPAAGSAALPGRGGGVKRPAPETQRLPNQQRRGGGASGKNRSSPRTDSIAKGASSSPRVEKSRVTYYRWDGEPRERSLRTETDEVGFEPTDGANRRRFSRPVPSTTWVPIRDTHAPDYRSSAGNGQVDAPSAGPPGRKPIASRRGTPKVVYLSGKP